MPNFILTTLHSSFKLQKNKNKNKRKYKMENRNYDNNTQREKRQL